MAQIGRDALGQRDAAHGGPVRAAHDPPLEGTADHHCAGIGLFQRQFATLAADHGRDERGDGGGDDHLQCARAHRDRFCGDEIATPGSGAIRDGVSMDFSVRRHDGDTGRIPPARVPRP